MSPHEPRETRRDTKADLIIAKQRATRIAVSEPRDGILYAHGRHWLINRREYEQLMTTLLPMGWYVVGAPSSPASEPEP